MQAPAEPQKTSFIERIARNVALSLNSKNVFGEPIEHNGIKVIPVAKVRYGFGGGSGPAAEEQAGKGAGGGAIASPIGYIELRDNQTRFKPIPNLVSLSLAILAAGLILKKIG